MTGGGAVACAAALLVVALPCAAAAQAVEVSPFVGYRFGGDFFEIVTGRPVDTDGTRSLGIAVDLPFDKDLQFEALYTHQHARLELSNSTFGPAGVWRVNVDHWQAGGLREFDTGTTRPFLTGTLGLTRYSGNGDSELRFGLGAGGGVKLLPTPRVGLRLDGRVFTTFVDANVGFLACTVGTCLVGFNANLVWQAEFSAALVVRFD
jgi:hypothetical protein